MSKPDGGPAFPHVITPDKLFYPGEISHGLSMRDYFAAAAMQAIYAGEALTKIDSAARNHNIEPGAAVAQIAYLAADAMLAERVK